MTKLAVGNQVCVPATRVDDGVDVWGTVSEINGAFAIVTASGQPRSVRLSRLRSAAQMDRRQKADAAAHRESVRAQERNEALARDIEAAKERARHTLAFAGVSAAGDRCVVVIANRITEAEYVRCEGNGGAVVFVVRVAGELVRVKKLLHQSRLATA